MRIPAWCDRVLLNRDPQFKKQLVMDKHNMNDNDAALPSYYGVRRSRFSDHRPVLAIYNLQTLKINRNKKEQLRKEILSKIMQSFGEGKVSKEMIA